MLKAARRSKARDDPPKPLKYYLEMAKDEAAKRTSDETVTPDETRRMTKQCLENYAQNGKWIRNSSPNGGWSDSYRVGPPPHVPGTLITEDLLATVKGATERRDAMRAGE